MKLEEISQIAIGILTKREIDCAGEKSYKLFSLKNYEENLKYEEIATSKDLSSKILKEEDLIFRLLYPNKIVYVDKSLEGIIIPSQFCIIRVQKDKMDPIVLKWYLESKRAEVDIKSKITGSIIKSMSLANLKTLEIPYITEEEQKKMRELIILWEEERDITRKILMEKKKLYDAYLEELLERGKHHARRSKF